MLKTNKKGEHIGTTKEHKLGLSCVSTDKRGEKSGPARRIAQIPNKNVCATSRLVIPQVKQQVSGVQLSKKKELCSSHLRRRASPV